MKTDSHHRGVVHAIELGLNGVVEVAHETRLLESGEVLLHERPKLGAQCHDRASVAAHVGKRDARDDAARTDGDVVNIPSRIVCASGNGVHPGRQACQLDQVGRTFVAGPGLSAIKPMRL